MSRALTFVAQRVPTGEILDWEVPLTLESPPRRDLSGPGGLHGTIPVEYGRLIGSDGLPLMDEWSTALYPEASGDLRGGYLINKSEFEGGAWRIEASGFTSYAQGQPYLGDYRPEGGVVDGFDAVREIWSHLQSYPTGNLGLVVDSQKAGRTVGSPPEDVEFETSEGKQVSFTSYDEQYRLPWWETRDCGQEIDQIATELPFDYFEEHKWAADGSDTVEHRLRLAYPRLGRKRDDLKFTQDNITAAITPARGENFANEVFALGAGEGSKSLRLRLGRKDGRLRRVHVLTEKSVKSKTRLRALADRELGKRSVVPEVPLIAVQDHPNAPTGSWRPGDDILVQAEIPWLGDVAVWHRIVSDQFNPDGTAVLTLVRSDFLA